MITLSSASGPLLAAKQVRIRRWIQLNIRWMDHKWFNVADRCGCREVSYKPVRESDPLNFRHSRKYQLWKQLYHEVQCSILKPKTVHCSIRQNAIWITEVWVRILNSFETHGGHIVQAKEDSLYLACYQHSSKASILWWNGNSLLHVMDYLHICECLVQYEIMLLNKTTWKILNC